MKKNLSKVLAMALAAAMMLSACGNSAPAETPSTPAEPSAPSTSTPAAPSAPAASSEKEEIKNLVLGKLSSRELETFNIIYSQSASDAEGLKPVWSCALKTNRAGQLQPELASDWGTEDGGKTWKLTIREGLKWADVNGEAVADLTAQDWATGLEWVLNAHKNLNNNTSMPSEMIVGAKAYNELTAAMSEEEAQALTAEPGSLFMETVGIEIPDATTVIYNCVSEKPYFDSLLSYYGMSPLSAELVANLGVEGIRGMDNKSMWYCGPYIMTEFIHGNSKTYEPNPHYWDTEVKRFESAEHRMIESNDVAFQLFQNGEVDYVSLTEAMVKTISSDPNNEMYEYLAPDWPTAYSYQMHFNFNKMNEDGSADENWNKAAANENFRLSWYYGLDMTEYWKRTNMINPLDCENNAFTARNLAWFSDGRDYTEIVKEKLGLPASDGTKPVRFDGTKGAEYKAKAMEELAAAGVTFPVEIDYYIQSSNQTALDTATVLADTFSKCLGDDYVKLNICSYVSSLTKEVRDPQLQSIVINGWGADYNDPQNFLGQITYGDANAYYSTYYNNINEVEENENTKALLDTFKEFTNMVKEADKITANMDERYDAYTDAEIFALQHALVVPCYYNVGWCLTNYDVYGEWATIALCNWDTNANHFTGEEIKATKAAMGK